jgi:F420-dependent oxidoreductase-like protein
MQLEVFIEPEIGASYDDILAFARETERLGFHGFFVADHYLLGGQSEPGPTDAWTTLAGLARDTMRIRLGTLVTPVTFRRPGPLAVTVSQIDAMSGGRIELALGTGHGELEHKAFGIPFPELGDRFDNLEETLAIIRGLWTTPPGEAFNFSGKLYTLVDNPALPKPVQRPHPPITVGGRGPKRTPRLAATYADELNVSYVPPEIIAESASRAREACEKIGRDPASLRISTTSLLACGRTDEEVERRIERMMTVRGTRPEASMTTKTMSYWKKYPGIDEVRGFASIGSPEQMIERIKAYEAVGVERVYLHAFDMWDLEHIALVAAEVLPHV